MRTGSGHSADVMAKTISAVRDVTAFSHVCSNPPRVLQELNAALRSCALEADREAVRATSNPTGYMANEAGDANTFNTLVEDIAEAFYIDKNLKTNNGGNVRRNKFRGYGQPSGRGNSSRRIPWDVCIVCGKKGCHSSNHRNRSRKEMKKFVKAYMAGNADEGGDDDHSGNESENDSDSDASVFVAFARNAPVMGIPHEHTDYVVDAAIIDTGYSTLSIIGEQLVPATRVASVRRTKPELANVSTKIGGVGGKVETKEL